MCSTIERINHKAAVFISCCQDKCDTQLKEVLKKIEKVLKSKGFCPIVAIRENFYDGNPQLMDDLKRSDYYLFINFVVNSEPEKFSIYSHQELAAAFALGFDKSNTLIFTQKGAPKKRFIELHFY